MQIRFTHRGSFDKTERFLKKAANLRLTNALDAAGREGVSALAAATPKESGLAASSWSYEITSSRNKVGIVWKNTNVENGFPVAIMLQYGYATGTGGYVAGRDYINPAMKPIFDRIADRVWKELTSG